MAEFNEQLKYLRKREHLTQSELANKVGLTKAMISMYERGQRKPSYEAEEALADVFNVSIDVLRGISEEVGSPDAARIIKQAKQRPDLMELFKKLCMMNDETIRKITMFVDMVEK